MSLGQKGRSRHAMHRKRPALLYAHRFFLGYALLCVVPSTIQAQSFCYHLTMGSSTGTSIRLDVSRTLSSSLTSYTFSVVPSEFAAIFYRFDQKQKICTESFEYFACTKSWQATIASSLFCWLITKILAQYAILWAPKQCAHLNYWYMLFLNNITRAVEILHSLGSVDLLNYVVARGQKRQPCRHSISFVLIDHVVISPITKFFNSHGLVSEEVSSDDTVCGTQYSAGTWHALSHAAVLHQYIMYANRCKWCCNIQTWCISLFKDTSTRTSVPLIWSDSIGLVRACDIMFSRRIQQQSRNKQNKQIMFR